MTHVYKNSMLDDDNFDYGIVANTDEPCYLYEYPNDDSNVICTVRPGETVEIISYGYEFDKISLGVGIIGYIFKEFLE